ncbi:hypothetical protein ACIO02_33945 [Streptomyces sp. NPDC087568]|uniref:hypothetical protein n=1 Tax=Streptomyces sp. NPDC087568 TaxID=3365799 RepID=UPI0038030734
MDAFADVAELRTYLDEPGLDDARAQLLLDAVSDEIRDALGWHVTEQKDITVTVDGSGDEKLLLPTRHLTDVTAVIEDRRALTGEDYLVYRTGYLTRVVSGFPIDWTRRPQGVTVTFNHGYAPGALPGVFRTVTLETVGRMWDNPAGALKSKTVGRVSWTYADVRSAVPPIEDQRLDVYRLPEGF